jgi:hypothetical protein
MSGQLHAPTALRQGESPRYRLYRRLGGRNEEIKILAPTETRTPISWSPASSQSPYRLRYPGSSHVTIVLQINEQLFAHPILFIRRYIRLELLATFLYRV